MGLDASYQAIPANCDLLERAGEDAELAEILCLIPHWFQRGYSSHPDWPAADALWKELKELSRRHPGLEKRNCCLDRSWDLLHYLLSAKRRGADATAESNLLEVAIRGGERVSELAVAPQGIPIRCVSPNQVDAIAALLRPLTAERLWSHYSPAQMESAGVYKFAPGREEHDWACVSHIFPAFQRFYLDVAGRGERVIVCLD